MMRFDETPREPLALTLCLAAPAVQAGVGQDAEGERQAQAAREVGHSIGST